MIHLKEIKKLKTVLFVVVCCSLLFAMPVDADIESENVTLTQIVQEIDALQILVNEADQQQPHYVRMRFQYAKLRADLQKIRNGIEQQLHQEAIEPRSEDPISGDYVDVVRLKP